MRTNQLRIIGAVLLALSLVGLRPTPTHAATALTVSACDESHFHAAVTQANTDNAGDTITFSCSGTITLSSKLSITGSMSISGNGQNVIIDGGNSVQMFQVSAPLTLDGLTLSHGSNSFGAAIYNTGGGTLYISNTTFSNNMAVGGVGGAIYNAGTIHLSNTTFSGNSAGLGGAIDNVAGQIISTHATFSGNSASGRGGAIENDSGSTVVLSDGSDFTGNSATGSSSGLGGAIFNSSGCTVTIHDATLFNNTTDSVGGAISSIGTLTVTNAVFSGNSAGSSGEGGALDVEGGSAQVTGTTFSNNTAQAGGAIVNFGSGDFRIDSSTLSNNLAGSVSPPISGDGGAILGQGGTTTITASTLSANTATSSGGAVRTLGGATLNIRNSTLASNSAQSGGAITSSGTTRLTNSTVTGNTIPNAGFGGGLFRINGTLSAGGTILSGNSEDGNPGNCAANGGSIDDGGYNLEWTGSTDTSTGYTCGFSSANNDVVGQDPMLGGLTGNGGPTSTAALQSGSSAIDQIPTSTGLCPVTDQRGYGRPDGTDTSCDIGAYESGAQPPAQTALSQISGSATYGGTATLTATLRDASNNLLPGEKVTFTIGNVPVCDVPGEPSCPETGSSGAGLGVATVSGVVIPPDHVHAIVYSGNVHAGFAGDTGYAGSAGTGDLTLSKASSSISANAATSITFGQSLTVGYEVSSAYGISGQTATGRVSVVQETGPGNLSCSPSSTGLSASQSDADGTGAANAGFDVVVDSSTNSSLEFSCSTSEPGAYTYHLHFNDTDQNYTTSNSSTQSLAVNQRVATNVSSVSGSAPHGGSATFTATLQDANSAGINGKTVTFLLWTGVWSPMCGVSGQPDCPTTQTTNGVDGVATLTGVTLPSLYTDAGTYSGDVQASFAGDADYIGSYNNGDLTVGKADQTISFGALPNRTYGDADFTVSATATSGLPVSFAASGKCTVSGSTVHLTGAGSCTITASQSGNNSYNAAPDVPQSFTIAQAGTSASVSSSANPSLVGQSVTYTATISPHPDGGSVAFTDGGSSIGCDSQTVNTSTGQATCTEPYNSAGSHSITAAYSGDANFAASAASNPLTQQVGYTVHLVSAKSLAITLQLWNAAGANVSASALTVTARCVVPYSATAPTTCPANPVQTINQPFTFQPSTRRTPAQYSYTLSSTGLTRKHTYYLLVQADGDPVWHAVAFTD